MAGKRRAGPVAAPPPTAPVEPAPRRAGRAEARRRRSARRRWIAIAVAVVLVLAAAAAAVFLPARSTPVRAARRAAAGRAQQTLLFQLRSASGTAAGSALLASDRATSSGVEVLVPGAVISEIPGSGDGPFAGALALPNGATLSRQALSDLLGVTVDGSWVIDEPTLSALVDKLGGIRVNVTGAVTETVPGGGQVIVVQPGDQSLDGAQAVDYATFLAAGAPPVSTLPELQGVLDGVMAALPKSPARIAGLLAGIGPGSQFTGVSPAVAAGVLAGFAAEDTASQVSYSTLPTVPIDTGAAEVSYRVDPSAVRALVTGQLAGSLLPGAFNGSNRVLVENGVGTPRLGESARNRLVAAGLVFVGSRNAPHFGYPDTLVLIFSATPQAEALGARVARALGVPPARAVHVATVDQTVADVIVILGADYHP